MKQSLFIIFISVFLFQTMTAQQDLIVGQQVELRTNDGNAYVGEVLTLTDNIISIKTLALGEIELQRSTVTKIIYRKGDEDFDDNGYPIDYHNSTHYFVNQSGFTLKKGQSYYENVRVFFNSYTTGITDNFSITGGLEVATLFGGSAPSLFITPKFSIPFGERAGGFFVGSTVFVFFANGDPLTVGVAQAGVTLGTRNNNFTIGSGIGYSFEDGVADSVLPFNLSGAWRLSKKISLMTDNFIIAFDDFNDATGILSAGIRIHFAKNGNALNIGLFRSTEFGDFFAFPFFSATIPFFSATIAIN